MRVMSTPFFRVFTGYGGAGQGQGGLQLWNLEFVSLPLEMCSGGRGPPRCRLPGGVNPVSGKAQREVCPWHPVRKTGLAESL